MPKHERLLDVVNKLAASQPDPQGVWMALREIAQAVDLLADVLLEAVGDTVTRPSAEPPAPRPSTWRGIRQCDEAA